MLGTRGRTPGLALAGIRWVKFATGSQGGANAIGKYLLEGLIGGLTLGIGSIIIWFASQDQANRHWFDRTTGIISISTRKGRDPLVPPAPAGRLGAARLAQKAAPAAGTTVGGRRHRFCGIRRGRLRRRHGSCARTACAGTASASRAVGCVRLPRPRGSAQCHLSPPPPAAPTTAAASPSPAAEAPSAVPARVPGDALIDEVPWAPPSSPDVPHREPTAGPAPAQSWGGPVASAGTAAMTAVPPSPSSAPVDRTPVATDRVGAPSVYPQVPAWLLEEAPVQAAPVADEVSRFAAPVGAVGDAEDLERTVARRPAGSVLLAFDDGTQHHLVGTGVLGRDPVPDAAHVGAERIPVHDPGRSISKTHLALSVKAGAVLVEDLHSTNGTSVRSPEGVSTSVLPGAPLLVGPGSTIRFGDRSVVVGEWYEYSPPPSAPAAPTVTGDPATASPPRVVVRHGVRTDVGCRREHNEDSYGARFPYFVVADGMGGHRDGALAAGIVVQEILDGAADGRFATAAEVSDSIARAARRVSGLGTDGAPGSTLTGLAFSTHRGQAVRARVQHRRLAHLPALRGRVSQVTTDHSEVQEIAGRGVGDRGRGQGTAPAQRDHARPGGGSGRRSRQTCTSSPRSRGAGTSSARTGSAGRSPTR